MSASPTIDPSEVQARLSATEAFRGLPDQALEDLAASAVPVGFEDGGLLATEGEVADRAFVIVDGRLQISVGGAGAEQHVATLGPGALVGEIAVLLGGARTATIRALGGATVLALDGDALRAIVSGHPGVAARLGAQSVSRLRRTQLVTHLARLFPDLDRTLLEAVDREVVWRHLPAGDVLVHQGDPAHAAFICVSGRLEARRREEGGETVAHIGPGALLGEQALLEDSRRTATVRAVRDAEVAELSREALARLSRDHPSVMLAVAREVASRVAAGPGAGLDRGAPPRTIALVSDHASVDTTALAEDLVARLSEKGAARVVGSQEIEADLGRGVTGRDPDAIEELRLREHLAALEDANEVLVLRADKERTAWTERVLRSADVVTIVADATEEPEPGPLERLVLELAGEEGGCRVVLTLLHPPDRPRPSGTVAWLDSRPSFVSHLHVRRDDPRHVDRWSRLLRGLGYGVVLGGGGARALAEIGVLRALREHRVPIDAVAGTSMGAVLAAAWALIDDLDTFLDRVRPALIDPLDHTLPVVSLTKGRKAVRGLRDVFGDADVADLWLPFACMSIDLMTNEAVTLRRGPLPWVLRASSALPGLFPPVARDGHLFVDGGLLDNLPLRTMRDLVPHGRVIGIDVNPPTGASRGTDDFGLHLSGTRVLLDRLLPGRRPPRVPGLSAMLLRATMVAATAERDRQTDDGLADLLVRPDVRHWNLVDFGAYDAIAEAGYTSTVADVEAWAADHQGTAGTGRALSAQPGERPE